MTLQQCLRGSVLHARVALKRANTILHQKVVVSITNVYFTDSQRKLRLQAPEHSVNRCLDIRAEQLPHTPFILERLLENEVIPFKRS